ncbi:MAG TPA: hypothetical protein VKH43_05330 [Thermoanaerobaculia bacterium]|nr:hypothetical protein [Thermoanaerobaculia bacterium]
MKKRTRREFVRDVGAAAVVLGSPLPRGLFAGVRAGSATEARTLFFNLSHLKGRQTTHFLYLAGRKYRMTSVAERPDVLDVERRRNVFLAAVPDDQITHHVQGALVPLDAMALAYSTSDENPSDGTWAMTSMFFQLPLYAVTHAYERARAHTPSGPLKLSGKRKRYGLRAALSEQDMREEQSLVDFSSHAEALVGLHPDILSIEPNSGAHIQNNYVSPDSNTQFLADQLQSMGPAVPQGGNSMPTPWATLKPVINDKTGKPFKKSDGKLNQYYPEWDPSVDPLTSSGVGDIHPMVKNDETLGGDVTGYNLNDPNKQPPPDKLSGRVWARHDGIPTIVQIAPILTGTGPDVAFTNQTPETGLRVWDPDHSTLQDGRVQVTLNSVSNWFLRWLGIWVQFLGPNGDVLAASALPSDTYPSEPGPYPRSQDKSDALFLGVVPPAFAILGVPVYPGSFSPRVRIPASASTMRVLYTGLGLSGSLPEDPQNVYDHGCLMTMAFNYGVVGLFMAAGSSTYGPTFKLAVSLGGGAVASAIQAILGSVENQASFVAELGAITMKFMGVLLSVGNSMVLTAISEAIAAELVAAEILDSVPVAGQIARAVAATTGAIQLAETSIEVAISPGAYIFDVVETHDLSITILPDPKDTQFPAPPSGYALYYKVTYLFDNGTAHTLDAVDVPDPTVKSINITFAAIPRGGMVNISIGFYMRQSRTPPGQNDWCAGFGTTGLVSNLVDQAPNLAITETKVPIQSTTQYLHTRKTSLDSSGKHFWLATGAAPPYTQPPGGQTPGLGDFNSITVRQGTSNPPQEGYVGYAWKAFSTSVNGCGNQAPGQFDQMANVNTDAGNGGRNAQNGYASSAALCGFQPGVRVGYNLLTHNSANIYLDTTSLMVRPVSLDPPSFPGPGSNQSFGQLNLDSDRCLLHPAGHIVSINNANHKIELLKLPRVKGQIVAVTDAQASRFHLARTVAGMGTRPGLVTSPVTASISPDGAILVLEAGNNRIQAFDLGGNPVSFFKGQPTPYFLQLDATQGFTYLDLAVEFTGYLYVLSRDSGNNHRLDIYHPTQSGTQPICSTAGVNAAKLTVDFWRHVYTLNYEVLQLPGAGIPGFTEPSVSLWLPTPPHEELDRRTPRFFTPRK